MPELLGVDVVTEAASHHRVAAACLEAGLHVQCEKPLALTMRGCNLLIETARQAGRILSVAENYRRDPMNRLIRALIEDGAIGTPQLLVDTAVGGGKRMIITPWRHRKLAGTIVLDAGTHNADVMQYYVGDADTVYGEGRLFEKYRYKGPAGGPGGFYAKWFDSYRTSSRPTARRAVRVHPVQEWRHRAVDLPPSGLRRPGTRAPGVRQ